jgi:hypothetical protein
VTPRFPSHSPRGRISASYFARTLPNNVNRRDNDSSLNGCFVNPCMPHLADIPDWRKHLFQPESNTIQTVIPMGKIEKGESCSVQGCSSAAIRSISTEKVARAGLSIGNVRRAFLCKAHYKEFKKLTRKDRQIDKWRFSA